MDPSINGSDKRACSATGCATARNLEAAIWAVVSKWDLATAILAEWESGIVEAEHLAMFTATGTGAVRRSAAFVADRALETKARRSRNPESFTSTVATAHGFREVSSAGFASHFIPNANSSTRYWSITTYATTIDGVAPPADWLNAMLVRSDWGAAFAAI